MSYYHNVFVPPTTGVHSFLWKINEYGEIVIESLPDHAPIVSSSRGMTVIDPLHFPETLNQMLSHRQSPIGEYRFVVVSQFKLWQFGVSSFAQLAARLNSKGSNKAKALWDALPPELLPDGGIEWDNEAKKYVVRADEDRDKEVERKEEAEHLELLEKSDNGVFTISAQGETTYVNAALLRLLEVREASTLVGQPFLPERFWVNPEDRIPLLGELERGKTNVRELALKTARGKRIYVTLFFTCAHDGQGKINGSQGMVYDVTEKRELATLRKAEQALRESERRYRLFAENAKEETDVHD